MNDLKTPYLDSEIDELKNYESDLSKDGRERLDEYRQIKDTLLEYELNKEGLARVCVENQRLKSNLEVIKAELEKMQKHFTAKDLELQTVKAELEMSKYTGQSAVNELYRYKQETDEIVKGLKAELKGFKRAEEHQRKNAVKALLDLGKAQAERDELRAFVRKWQKATLDEMMDLEDESQELLKGKQ